jgi:uncharacterized membrane protein
MNKGTKVRTALAIATSIHTALIATDVTGFSNPTVDTIYKVLSIVANFVVIALTTYYNNDYTKEACEHTGAMRLEKEQLKKGVITGENFFDESEEIGEGGNE